MSTGGPTELHTVLSLIDRSLEELKANPPTVSFTIDDAASLGGGAAGGAGQQHQQHHHPSPSPLGPADAAFINDLTVDLLSEQKKSALLEEENTRLRQRLARFQQRMGGSGGTGGMGGGSGGGGGMYGGGGSFVMGSGGGSSGSAGSKGTHLRLGLDLQNIVSTIHAQVERQSSLIKQKQEDGMCILAHRHIQAALDRCLMQLASLRDSDRDTQRQQTELEDTAERCRDRLKAAEMEIQYMQEQRSTLQHQLEAFEAENMRLTNDIEELRFSSAQQQRQLDTVLAAPQRLGLEAPGDDNTTALLETRRADALRIAELEKQTRRLQNELDEAMNTRTEYKKNDVGTG